MKVIKYDTLEALKEQAAKDGKELFETPVSFSYRLWEGRKSSALHIYYKP